jgi:hypothetical protein
MKENFPRVEYGDSLRLGSLGIYDQQKVQAEANEQLYLELQLRFGYEAAQREKRRRKYGWNPKVMWIEK